MDLKELRGELQVRENKYLDEKNELMRSYAEANRTAEIGDVVKEVCGIASTLILVDHIGWNTHTSTGEPINIYEGVLLKKDMTPRGDGERECIWQCDMDENLGKQS